VTMKTMLTQASITVQLRQHHGHDGMVVTDN
jgi:hypothetical protein